MDVHANGAHEWGSNVSSHDGGAILTPHLWTLVVVYLDDVFIYTNTIDNEHHIRHVDEVI